MAIALLALVTFGGANYLNNDKPVKIKVSYGLQSQYEAISTGIANYRSSNNGLMPSSIDQFKGFLYNGEVPSFAGEFVGVFNWTAEINSGETVVCVELNTNKNILIEAFMSFAKEADKKGATPIIGNSCGVGTPYAENFDVTSIDPVFITLKGV